MNPLQRLPAQLLATWRGLSPGRRFAAVTLAALVAVAAVSYAYLTAGGEYRPVMANLSPEEASTVLAKLQTQGVPCKLDAGGTAVLVPEDRLVQVRVALAADSLPARGGK